MARPLKVETVNAKNRWKTNLKRQREPSAKAKREFNAVLVAREAIVPPLRRFEQALKKHQT